VLPVDCFREYAELTVGSWEKYSSLAENFSVLICNYLYKIYSLLQLILKFSSSMTLPCTENGTVCSLHSNN
jgi:hypothetical protein